jgi:putative endonuclease
MWYVYIIRSLSSPAQEYTGLSEDLKQRINDHNAGKSTHTSKYMPWELVWYCAFSDKRSALDFETYLKSHSGRAFASKRLTPRHASVQQESARRLIAMGGSDPDAVAAPRRRFQRSNSSS